MATIELQNICQHFERNARAHLEEVIIRLLPLPVW
jgi:hypothetical protein